MHLCGWLHLDNGIKAIFLPVGSRDYCALRYTDDVITSNSSMCCKQKQVRSPRRIAQAWQQQGKQTTRLDNHPEGSNQLEIVYKTKPENCISYKKEFN